MTRTECAGLRVVKSNLDPNREEVILSMVDRGPYGPIEDWNGEIVIEILPIHVMNDEATLIIAQALANDEIYRSVIVSAWNIKREGKMLHLTPKEWEEVDSDSGYRI